MCMQDIQLGRQTYTSEISLSVGESAIELVSSSPNRIALIISAPSTGTITISTNPAVSANNGIILTSGIEPTILNIKDHGDIVRKRLYVIGSTTSITTTVISIILQEQKGTTNAN
jgi:hypothetical protein